MAKESNQVNLPQPIDISEALHLLHTTYPDERVHLSVTLNEKTYALDGSRVGLRIFAVVGDDHNDWVLSDFCDNAMEAAQALIAKAGKRDPLTRQKQALAKAKADYEQAEKTLRELEAQTDPFEKKQ